MTNTAIATVNTLFPSGTPIIVAASGFAPVLTQIVAVNQEAGVRVLTLRDNAAPICSPIPIPGSGTFVWDDVGGKDGLRLTIGSGLNGYVDVAGDVSVTAYYNLDDERTPLLKYIARKQTYIPYGTDTATRAPNRMGGQQES